ncbi:YopX family protein [uncultured Helicobacter sp.]|uniref:YopX family protein n=1 Tax=uncultured Helicobacter sp. TaxID=175537 RepID=UPI00374E228F
MESIKFRVWDSFLKKYIDKEETDINTGDPLIIYQFIDTSYNEKNVALFITKQEIGQEGRYIIEEYIGIKDKNNREIFEGDIIKLKNDDRFYTVEYVKEFCAYCLNFTPKDEELNEKDKYLNKEEQKGYIPLWRNSDECEIIGNRWEYPQEKGR